MIAEPIHVIGGGLAGTEAAWQVARRGLRVVLHEMRPVRRTPAHQTDRLAELVCSNSLKSESGIHRALAAEGGTAAARIRCCSRSRRRARAGRPALTVDRDIFAREVTARDRSEPLIELRREEVTAIPDGAIVIIASGPLTSDALAPGDRAPHRLGPAVLLRQHQPDRGCRDGRYDDRVLGVALWQIDSTAPTTI